MPGKELVPELHCCGCGGGSHTDNCAPEKILYNTDAKEIARNLITLQDQEYDCIDNEHYAYMLNSYEVRYVPSPLTGKWINTCYFMRDVLAGVIEDFRYESFDHFLENY